MTITRTDRRVVTFYSYKGGVGRSMALANVAFRLADTHALDVVVVDWDLEAPGLAQFFEVPPEKLAEAHGVLDYLEAWREGAKRRDPSPPDARPWLIPIQEAPRAPRHGSLSLLIAGRPDGHYDARLAALDWKELYTSAAGALAVETLRRQLVEAADVVLVDSRTGLTDAGGICTIQIPDAVVLMTAPNRQSLDGTERIARSIAGAEPRARAGRGRSMVWLSVCRLPSAEETPLAEQWLDAHKPDFERMISAGLLDREAHREGLGTHTIPQRARWGFDEVLFTEHVHVGRGDSLLAAYQHLTVTILDWALGSYESHFGGLEDASPGPETSIEALEKRARDAEARRDSHGQVAALLMLGTTLRMAKRFEEALLVLRRAADMALGAELHVLRGLLKLQMGFLFQQQKRYDEAVAEAREIITLGRDLEDSTLESSGEGLAASAVALRDGVEAAIPHFTRAIAKARASGNERWAAQILRAMVTSDQTSEGMRKLQSQGASWAQKLLIHLRTTKERSHKITIIRALLQLADNKLAVLDADNLRAQLDALHAEDVNSGAPTAVVKKKSPRRRPAPKP